MHGRRETLFKSCTGSKSNAIHADGIARRLFDVVVDYQGIARLKEPDPGPVAHSLADIIDEAVGHGQAKALVGVGCRCVSATPKQLG